ncbi:MAG: hypothetical protein NTV86_21400 [Planctomycetota bacterium]|nr:hypothetical protein [Planctomycetota bacterium]
MNKRKLARGVSLAVVLLSAAFYILCSHWLQLLGPFLFDETGNFRSDGIFKELSPAIMGFFGHLSSLYSCVLPLAMFLAGLAGVIALRPAGEKPGDPGRSHRIGVTGIVVGGVANGLVLVFSSGLFFVHPGEHIRPMGWASLMFNLALVTLYVSLPISVVAIIREKPRYVGVISVVLGITPLPFAMILLHGLSAIIGFGLAE